VSFSPKLDQFYLRIYTRVSTRKRTRFVSCRTEKEAETGLQEEIIFIEEEEEEEDHG
jgi:hypothetical protein